MPNESVDMLKFEDKLKYIDSKMIWQEYCGFLDLSIDEYMEIQNRLMKEQLTLWTASGLGKKMMKGAPPDNINDFRARFPLTEYQDYADVLLQKNGAMLPDHPIIWIQTTWEGGSHPIKTAPYTKGMLDTYKRNVIACMMLGTSRKKGQFDIKAMDTFLYGLAPLPYATGLYPRALDDEIQINFLPPVHEAEGMSFSERNKKGFKMGLHKGIDYFFGLGSVAYYMSLSLGAMSGSGNKKLQASDFMSFSPKMIRKYLQAKKVCKRENRSIMPKDLFELKAFMVAGTDNNCYKDELEELWGIRPMELFAGTEPSCIGTETWTREGMYFFPDTCFYEFIPESELKKEEADSSYRPNTCLMNEVRPDEKYELVISVLKGGAFMRYRVGDMYMCVGLENSQDQTKIPRFKYIDRVRDIIDIGGFTRISKNSIQNVVDLSGLHITGWTAYKEFTKNNKPMMHMYVEMDRHSLASQAVSREILKEHLTIYFKYVDSDYKDLKRILGMDPLEITILKSGTFAAFSRKYGEEIRKINPDPHQISALLKMQFSEPIVWEVSENDK
jgi:hypothetical protein